MTSIPVRCTKRLLMEYLMQYLEEQTLSWKYMAWRVFLKKTWKREGESWNRRTKVVEQKMPSILSLAQFWRVMMLVPIFRNSKEKAKPG